MLVMTIVVLYGQSKASEILLQLRKIEGGWPQSGSMMQGIDRGPTNVPVTIPNAMEASTTYKNPTTVRSDVGAIDIQPAISGENRLAPTSDTNPGEQKRDHQSKASFQR